MFIHLKTQSEPGKLATPYNLPRARDLVSLPEKKRSPSSLGLPATVFTEVGEVGGRGAVMGGHTQEYSK